MLALAGGLARAAAEHPDGRPMRHASATPPLQVLLCLLELITRDLATGQRNTIMIATNRDGDANN